MSSSKVNYSLFGNSELGYRRFLYDAYMPFDHPAQGIQFVLTPDKQDLMYKKVKKIEMKIVERIKHSLNDRIWPVDRWIILLNSHCYVNALERVKCLLKNSSPENIRFNTAFNSLNIEPVINVKEFLMRGKTEIYEQILIAILKHNSVEVRHDPSLRMKENNKDRDFKRSIAILKSLLKSLWLKYRYLKSLQVKNCWNSKSLLLISNLLLSDGDYKIIREASDIFFLDCWINITEHLLNREMLYYKRQVNKNSIENREMFEYNLDDIRMDEEDHIFRKAIPVIVKYYPFSLIEGREYLKKQAHEFFEKLAVPSSNSKAVIMSTDHRIWKNEVFSAFASEVVGNRGCVVSNVHGSPGGFLDYDTTHTVDQCLVTHYLSNFKKPFPQIEDETPEVIQIELLKRFHAIDNKKTRSNIFSIWYFPHWHVIDPAFSFIFHGVEHPEGYFDNQKNALSGLNMIADNPKIKEIVVKLRNDVPEKVRKTYMQLMDQILGNNISAKFRLVYNLSSAQAFPYVSIAVHDMFSSGFVESMWADIPTIAMLPQEQGVPSRLPDREYWINSGVFVRDKDELFKSLLAWVEGKMPDNYEQMKTRLLTHCGLGSPTAGQALKLILRTLIY